MGALFDNWIRRMMTWSPSVLTTKELKMISKNRARLEAQSKTVIIPIELKGKHWCEHNAKRH